MGEKKLIEDLTEGLYKAFFIEKNENEIELRFPSFEEKQQKDYGGPDKEKVKFTIEKKPADDISLRDEIRNILLLGYVRHLVNRYRYPFSKERFREEVLNLFSIVDYVAKPTNDIRSDLAMFSSEPYGMILSAEDGYTRSNDIIGVLKKFYSDPQNRMVYERERRLISSMKFKKEKID